MGEKLLPDGTLKKENNDDVECIICHEKIQINIFFPLEICTRCAYEIFLKTSDRIEKIDEQICHVYGIQESFDITNIPYTKCHCGNKEIVSIDYFTPKSEDNDFYDLFICGICRSCMGYRVIKIDGVAIPFELRPRPFHVGIDLSLFDLNEKIDDKDLRYIS